jgi:hypothetical protein
MSCFRKHTFDRPPGFEPRSQSAGLYFQLSAPLGKRLAFAFPSVKNIWSAIVALDLASGPTAVVRFIRAININSINRMQIRRALSHVSVEIFEGIFPSLTDRDTATSVAFICGIIWISASGLQAQPSPILDRFAAPMSAMHFAVNSRFFAATRGGFPVSQIRGRREGSSAAVALAMPSQSVSVCGFVTARANDGKCSKAQSGHLDSVPAHMQDFTLFGVN